MPDGMKTVAPPKERSREQATQRVKVGMVGLAAVMLLIGLASAIFSTVNTERPVTAVGASRSDVVANLVAENDTAPTTGANEPLAELGVAPAVDAAAVEANAAAPITPPPVRPTIRR